MSLAVYTEIGDEAKEYFGRTDGCRANAFKNGIDSLSVWVGA
jgi:hypothetical protein